MYQCLPVGHPPYSSMRPPDMAMAPDLWQHFFVSPVGRLIRGQRHHESRHHLGSWMVLWQCSLQDNISVMQWLLNNSINDINSFYYYSALISCFNNPPGECTVSIHCEHTL